MSIRQTVGETIRRAPLECRFRPGQALSAVALSSEMNVSRGPVREALIVLAQEGTGLPFTELRIFRARVQ